MSRPWYDPRYCKRRDALLAANDICGLIVLLLECEPVVKISTMPEYLAATLALVSRGEAFIVESTPKYTKLSRTAQSADAPGTPE